MDWFSALLLLLSITLSAGRNTLSKHISAIPFGTRRFFLAQFALFGTGCIILLAMGGASFAHLAPVTCIYAVVYGAFLLLAQWCYTMALGRGKLAVCSTVYSLGFIFPTLWGTFAGIEQLSLLNTVGILLVIPAVVLSGSKSAGKGSAVSGKGYAIPLILAMIASGALGILQKLQQLSPFPEQKGAFLVLSFVLAAVASLILSQTAHRDDAATPAVRRDSRLLFAAGIGVCFSVCNFLNTTLAGRLPGAVFFPLLNVSAILLSMLLGLTLYKERMTRKDAIIAVLGFAAIILINLK